MNHLRLYENAKEFKLTKINLGNGLFALIDDDDFDKVSKYNWHLIQNNYAGTSTNKGTLAMHVLIMNPPKGFVIDHKDGDRLDNRKSNLRIVTQAENSRNKLKFMKASSEFKGIHFNNSKQKWIASITYNGNKILLGWFKDEEKAARAYNIGAEMLNDKFGKFYKYNDTPNYSDEMVLTPYNYKKLCNFVDVPFDNDKHGDVPLRKGTEEYNKFYNVGTRVIRYRGRELRTEN